MKTQPRSPSITAAQDEGEVLFRIDTRAMPTALKKDLEANAHLSRTSPEGLLAQRLTARLASFGITLLPA